MAELGIPGISVLLRRQGGRPHSWGVAGLPLAEQSILCWGGWEWAETVLGKETGGLESHFLVCRCQVASLLFIIRANVETKFRVAYGIHSILWCLRACLPACLHEHEATSHSVCFYCGWTCMTSIGPPASCFECLQLVIQL